MTAPSPVPFPAQRLVALALVSGMGMYMVAVAVVLQSNDGRGLADAPIPGLDVAVPAAGIVLALAAVIARQRLRGRGLPATLVPLALLEGGSLLGSTAWLLHGEVVPHLVTALVLLALAIAIVPLWDPEAGGAGGAPGG